MTSSLPSCQRLHPGIPSQITESPRAHRNCRVCKRLRNQGRRTGPARSPGMLYGIVRLCWTPPERLL